MPKLKTPVSFETAFDKYVAEEIIGEGGAGRVYGGFAADGTPVALKILSEDRSTADRRRRFKNEIAFLARNKHPNIVTVTDHGVSSGGEIIGPFYVMRRYVGSLRDLMRNGISPDIALVYFSQILDGIDAAHQLGAVHRDVKPENILYDENPIVLAIADFGIASFTEDLVATSVETTPAQRLANFEYAAPEQRKPGNAVQAAADIYALGLILNEMFTGVVPHGTDYRSIGQVSAKHGFLDETVAKMLRQAPAERPSSITELKRLIQRHEAEAVSLQRLSKIDGTVIKSSEIDEPLAQVPPRLVDFDWDQGQLTLKLDRPVTPEWIQALNRMPGYSAVLGKGPQVFTFRGNQAHVRAAEHEIQAVIDNFKVWLPLASRTLKQLMEDAARREEAQQKERLRLEREAEEGRLRVRRKIKL